LWEYASIVYCVIQLNFPLKMTGIITAIAKSSKVWHKFEQNFEQILCICEYYKEVTL